MRELAATLIPRGLAAAAPEALGDRAGPAPGADDGELRTRIAFGLWIAVGGTLFFAIGDAILAPDALWALYPVKGFYLLAIAGAFRALQRASDAAAVTRVALVAIGLTFLVSSLSSTISRDPLTPPVLACAVTLAGAALVPWSVWAQSAVVALAALALIGRSLVVDGNLAALVTYPSVVIATTFGLSIYLAHLLAGYRAAADDAERRLRAEARISAALARVGRELIAALDTGALLDRLAQLTVEVFACSASQTWMRDRDGYFRVAAGVSDDPEELEALRALSLPTAAMGPLLDRLGREGIVTLDAAEIDALPTAALSRRSQVAQVIFLPLSKGDEVVGVHTVVFRRGAPALDAAVPQLAAGIAQLATLTLETARLVEATNAADRLKTEFLANLSHELRTPLNVIIGYNEMLLDGSCGMLAGEQQAILDRVQHNARELLALMGAALELSRHEGRGLPLVLEPVSVAVLIGDLAREVAALPPVPGVEFRWSVAPEMPPLLTDALKLRMILKNLIDNARKYTEHGHVALDARPAASGVELAVSDTGSGIPADELERIFEPFRQIGGGRAPGGVGLGLYLVRRLAEALGGRVDARSRLGGGSTFRVWLPLRATPH